MILITFYQLYETLGCLLIVKLNSTVNIKSTSLSIKPTSIKKYIFDLALSTVF